MSCVCVRPLDEGWHPDFFFFFFTLVTGPRRSLSLKLSDTRVYEPQIRARLGTTAPRREQMRGPELGVLHSEAMLGNTEKEYTGENERPRGPGLETRGNERPRTRFTEFGGDTARNEVGGDARSWRRC